MLEGRAETKRGQPGIRRRFQLVAGRRRVIQEIFVVFRQQLETVLLQGVREVLRGDRRKTARLMTGFLMWSDKATSSETEEALNVDRVDLCFRYCVKAFVQLPVKSCAPTYSDRVASSN